VDELHAEPDLLPRALELAEERARLPRQAYARIKRQLRGDTLAAAEAEADDPLMRGWLGDETARASAGILERDAG
jgi:hypothetical protein